jgi:hypothetical protein
MPSVAKRPGMLTFVAFLLFIFGFIYALNAVSSGFYAVNVAMNPEPPDPKAKVEMGDTMAMLRFVAAEIPAFAIISLVVAVLDVLFSIGQLVCGAAIWRLAPAGRKSTIFLMLIRLVYLVGFDIFGIVMVVPIYVRFFERAILMQQAGGLPVEGVGFIIGAAFYGIYAFKILLEVFVACLVILILTSQTAKIAFGEIAPEPEAPPPQEKPRSQYAGYEIEE